MFFFEKKNQKTFAIRHTWPSWLTHQSTKVFCFFSSEKKTFLGATNSGLGRPGVVGRRAILPAKARLGSTAAILGGFVLVFGLEYLTWYYI
jgi:hypothetical protein